MRFGEKCVPLRRYWELSVLAHYPHIAGRFPDGDLSEMGHWEFAELVNHLRAERDDRMRRLEEAVTGAMLATPRL